MERTERERHRDAGRLVVGAHVEHRVRRVAARRIAAAAARPRRIRATSPRRHMSGIVRGDDRDDACSACSPSRVSGLCRRPLADGVVGGRPLPVRDAPWTVVIRLSWSLKEHCTGVLVGPSHRPDRRALPVRLVGPAAAVDPHRHGRGLELPRPPAGRHAANANRRVVPRPPRLRPPRISPTTSPC